MAGKQTKKKPKPLTKKQRKLTQPGMTPTPKPGDNRVDR